MQKNSRHLLLGVSLYFVGQLLILPSAVTRGALAAEDKVPDKKAATPSSAHDRPATQEAVKPVLTSLEAEKAPAEISSDQAQTASSPAASLPGNVTIDFKDADIQNVLRILSYKSGVNIVAGKDVTGIVTIRLVDVPWEKALDVVLKTYGYAYDRDGSIIRVTTIENLKKEELSTEVFQLNYAQAVLLDANGKEIADSGVKGALSKSLSSRGTMRADSRTNTLIVTDMPTSIQQAKKVIERLDKITPQVVIEAKIIETTLGNSEQLGIKWNVQANVAGSARPTTLPFPARQTSEWSRFMPEGRAPTTTTTVDSLGVAHADTTSDFPVNAPGSVPNFPVVDKAEFKFGTLDFTQFQALLQMINNRTDTKILSEPHITTLNNQLARVQVGETIGIPLFERNATTGRMEITGYTNKDLGITLKVTPQINDQSEIVVKIEPEITTLIGFENLAADVQAPHYSTRNASTQVRIRNGQTIAIGGLIRENVVDSKNQVPILGDIPFFGKIFSHKDKTIQKTDLLFFVTVNIVSDKTDWEKGHASKL
ncbi:MAG: hypothetical protein COT00_03175 [Candidatus Omnitrophica bacterium CG07_land_8_20_14_0_80_50_8]|nr:MAG: hypothetical protein AUJ71_04155 [Candidatus Omnitrophica bacterium CG1_02_49_16]PIU40157.1 MAG: hypothetical protein COT00_03175 [Candidatus Omnitrophica bacterium CG07_land_8_20_14_0_80_50_8]